MNKLDNYKHKDLDCLLKDYGFSKAGTKPQKIAKLKNYCSLFKLEDFTCVELDYLLTFYALSKSGNKTEKISVLKHHRCNIVRDCLSRMAKNIAQK